jgi:hypothetical protein
VGCEQLGRRRDPTTNSRPIDHPRTPALLAKISTSFLRSLPTFLSRTALSHGPVSLKKITFRPIALRLSADRLRDGTLAWKYETAAQVRNLLTCTVRHHNCRCRPYTVGRACRIASKATLPTAAASPFRAGTHCLACCALGPSTINPQTSIVKQRIFFRLA